jgi:hypothetical protein
MPLNLKKASGGGGSTAQPLEEGSYPARIVQIIDLGLQEQRPYQGQEKPPAYEMNITYELLDEFMLDEDGKEDEEKPRWISEIIPVHNLKSDKAKSTKRYMALDPNLDHDGDFTALLGEPCNVTIVNNEGKGVNKGKVYNNVAGISAMRPKDAAKAPDLVNPSVVFSLDEPDVDVFNKFPDFLKDRIKNNLEYNGSPLAKQLGGESDEEESSDEDW